MRLATTLWVGLLLGGVSAVAADRIGDGTEAEWNPVRPAPTPAVDVPVKPPVRVAEIDPLKPPPKKVEPSVQAPLVPARNSDPVSTPLAVSPAEPLAPLPLAPAAGPAEPQQAPADVAGDLPGTVAARTTSPFHVEMEDFPGSGNLSPKAEKTLNAVAELKKLIGLISRDLDAGGMERTRLIFNAEAISKETTTIASLYGEVPPLVSCCVNAKRTALVLEEELRNEPRRWSHVRWAFQDCQKQIQELRRMAARLAGAEPQMVRVEKKGKVTYVEAPKTLEQLQAEAEEKRRQALKDERDQNREREKDIKATKEKIPVNYDR